MKTKRYIALLIQIAVIIIAVMALCLNICAEDKTDDPYSEETDQHIVITREDAYKIKMGTLYNVVIEILPGYSDPYSSIYPARLEWEMPDRKVYLVSFAVNDCENFEDVINKWHEALEYDYNKRPFSLEYDLDFHAWLYNNLTAQSGIIYSKDDRNDKEIVFKKDSLNNVDNNSENNHAGLIIAAAIILGAIILVTVTIIIFKNKKNKGEKSNTTPPQNN